jgi:hypothetical protein
VNELIKLAAALLELSRLAHRPRVDWRRGGIALALMLTAIPLSVAAAGCAGAGLWICVQPLVGTVGAALATGLALLAISAALAIVARRLLRRRTPTLTRVAEAAPRLNQADSGQVDPRQADPRQADRGALLFAAFAAGLSAGAARTR